MAAPLKSDGVYHQRSLASRLADVSFRGAATASNFPGYLGPGESPIHDETVVESVGEIVF